jgi:hypothetical protein
MASTFTDLGIELMATGENAGTWGDKTNTNLNIINQAAAGYQAISIAGGANTTTLGIQDGSSDLTGNTNAARNLIIDLTGTITGNQVVTVPDSVEKSYIVKNNTSGGFTVEFKTVSGTGYTFGATEKETRILISDGTNIVDTGFSSVAINSVVEDTTPQLGGDLDANGHNILIDNANFIGDESGNEQLKFATTASAVNEISVTNAATTNPPAISATGGDTNIDLNLTPKGIGRTTFNGGGKIQQVAEKVTTEATAATGTVNYDVITQAVWNFTTDASANWTLNVRGDASNSLDSIMDTGESLTIAHIVSQGATAYYNSAFQIDGSSVTPEWQGGSAPTGGNASSLDTYSYTIIKTASATFTVLAAQTQFA